MKPHLDLPNSNMLDENFSNFITVADKKIAAIKYALDPSHLEETIISNETLGGTSVNTIKPQILTIKPPIKVTTFPPPDEPTKTASTPELNPSTGGSMTKKEEVVVEKKKILGMEEKTLYVSSSLVVLGAISGFLLAKKIKKNVALCTMAGAIAGASVSFVTFKFIVKD